MQEEFRSDDIIGRLAFLMREMRKVADECGMRIFATPDSIGLKAQEAWGQIGCQINELTKREIKSFEPMRGTQVARDLTRLFLIVSGLTDDGRGYLYKTEARVQATLAYVPTLKLALAQASFLFKPK